MKKLIKMIMVALFAVPVVVSAKVYTPGEVANFVTNDNEYAAIKDVDWENPSEAAEASKQGTQAIIIEDKGEDAKYVRALAIASKVTTENKYDNADYKQAGVFRTAKSMVEEFSMVTPYIKSVDDAANLDFITLQELKTVFGADFTNPEVGVISVDEYKSSLGRLATKFALDQAMATPPVGVTFANGFYTGTVEGDKVWVVEFGMDASEGLTSIEVKKVPLNSTTLYHVVPVLNFGKEYDCHYNPPKYACYKCGKENWIWTQVGTQEATCEFVTSVVTEKDCIPGPPTGVADYALEIIALVAVGTCLMVILKKKDFFIGA